MSLDFLSRIVGMVIFAIFGARIGVDLAPTLGIRTDLSWFLCSLIGVLIGLILTPWMTIRPVKLLRQSINELSIEVLVMALLGTFIGLFLSLLLAYPISLLPAPFGQLLPPFISATAAYLGATTFGLRSREVWDALGNRAGSPRSRMMSLQSNRQLLLDTSVLIDGRIVEIAKTGFLGGVLLVPRFVLAELHQVADSSDMLRRNRGRRGLTKLTELQRGDNALVKIIEEDIDDIAEVDTKLVALALQLDASIVTNDYNLNKVATAQGVPVLNINALANAVRTVHIPGETFPIHVIQEGRDLGQGVGYLEDGTMVVIENGRSYMDRTINVTVTRLINRDTGRMIFAVPENERRHNHVSHLDNGEE
jgi:uncharacterized protein YacL